MQIPYDRFLALIGQKDDVVCSAAVPSASECNERRARNLIVDVMNKTDRYRAKKKKVAIAEALGKLSIEDVELMLLYMERKKEKLKTLGPSGGFSLEEGEYHLLKSLRRWVRKYRRIAAPAVVPSTADAVGSSGGDQFRS